MVAFTTGGGKSPWRILVLVGALALGSCVRAPHKPTPQPAPVPEPAQPRQPSPEEVRQRAVAYFLSRAEGARQKGFLTQPAGASAYDHYLRVLQLDPGNVRAESGIQTLVIEYVQRARDALRRRAFGEVTAFLSQAEALAPGNVLVAEVRTQLAGERSRASANPLAGDEIPLPAGSLANRDEAVLALLKNAAGRIRREGRRVIIVARNDAEGRWIYQQLREAVPGYRVRGDIRLGQSPRLILTGGEP
ncbi:N-acetylglucosaminyltransferase [Microbulbifer sp. TYP-18]|uniref:N-acetylglucosaminyltransferase n=1 Tax=Microbulbifer sp. TYP-18 TaxID=3230024 RepID=UPI0034C5E50F